MLCRCRNATLQARVALVSKEEQDKAKSTAVEDFLPLRQLGVNGRGLPCEDEIALATVNTRKELQKKRKAEKHNKDKENTERPRKGAKTCAQRPDRKKENGGAKASKGNI